MSITKRVPIERQKLDKVFVHRIVFDFQGKSIEVQYNTGYIDKKGNEIVKEVNNKKIIGKDFKVLINNINKKLELQNKIEKYLIDQKLVDGTIDKIINNIK